MHGISEASDFIPVRIAVLTISDTRTAENDTSGDTLVQRLEAAGHILADRGLLRDDTIAIRQRVLALISQKEFDVIITTGGTGLTGRDITPEAIRPLFEKEIEGFSVVFHQVSFKSVGLSTLQSRASAGLANGTFIFLLPGSTGAVKDAWDNIIHHQIDSRYRPCNLVEIMPRLLEK